MFNVKRKDDEFFEWFAESANYFHSAALMMDEVMLSYTHASDKQREITDLEHAADAVNAKILDKLNQSFITPIDREDIYMLANFLASGIDQLHEALQRIIMYRTGQAKQGAIELTKRIIGSTKELVNIFTLMKNIRKNKDEIMQGVENISQFESEGDDIYRREVAFLFDNVTDPIELIKWKDILEELEDTLDHCDRLGNMVRGVVMKYA